MFHDQTFGEKEASFEEHKKEENKGDVMKVLGRRWLLICVAVSAVTTLQAQDSQVSGEIRDVSQAAVAGAKIALTRVETGDHREVTSGGEGYYSFPLLVPGHYT